MCSVTLLQDNKTDILFRFVRRRTMPPAGGIAKENKADSSPRPYQQMESLAKNIAILHCIDYDRKVVTECPQCGLRCKKKEGSPSLGSPLSWSNGTRQYYLISTFLPFTIYMPGANWELTGED